MKTLLAALSIVALASSAAVAAQPEHGTVPHAVPAVPAAPKQIEKPVVPRVEKPAVPQTVGTVQAIQPQSVVVHLSKFTHDLHASFMALHLATAMAKQGAKVTLMLDLEGVRLVDGRIPAELRYGTSEKLGEAFEAFVKAGGTALVCPHCAMVAGVKQADLRKGARISTQEEIARLMLEAHKVIDY